MGPGRPRAQPALHRRAPGHRPRVERVAPGELSSLEVDFLAAGLEAERKQKADEVAAARRLYEEAEARRRAEEERAREAEQRAQEARQYAKRQRQLKRLANEAARKARREAIRAQSLLLATRSNEVHDEKPLLALLLSVEAARPLLKGDVNTPRLTTTEQTLIQTIDILPRHRIFVADYSYVHQIAFAPDGKALASAAADGTVRLWDLTAADPAARPRVLTHDGPVWHVAFAPDGKALASASRDGTTVRLWDLTAADPAAHPRVLRHDDAVNHVAFAPDGKALASASA